MSELTQAIDDYIATVKKAIKQNSDQVADQLPEYVTEYSPAYELVPSQDDINEVQAHVGKILGVDGLNMAGLLLKFTPDDPDHPLSASSGFTSTTFFEERIRELSQSIQDEIAETSLAKLLSVIAVAQYFKEDNEPLFRLFQGFAASANPVLVVNNSSYGYTIAINHLQVGNNFTDDINIHDAKFDAFRLSEELFHHLDFSLDYNSSNPIHSGSLFRKLCGLDMISKQDSKAIAHLDEELRQGGYSYKTHPQEVFAKYANARANNIIPSNEQGLMSAYYDNIVKLDIELISSGKGEAWIKAQRNALKAEMATLDKKIKYPQNNVGDALITQITRDIKTVGDKIKQQAFGNTPH